MQNNPNILHMVPSTYKLPIQIIKYRCHPLTFWVIHIFLHCIFVQFDVIFIMSEHELWLKKQCHLDNKGQNIFYGVDKLFVTSAHAVWVIIINRLALSILWELSGSLYLYPLSRIQIFSQKKYRLMVIFEDLHLNFYKWGYLFISFFNRAEHFEQVCWIW